MSPLADPAPIPGKAPSQPPPSGAAAASLPPAFAGLRLRGLVGLMIATGLPVGAALAALSRLDSPAVHRWLFPALMAWGYGIPTLWMAVMFHRRRISWRRLLGPAPPPGPLAAALGLTLVQLTLSAASFFALVYLLAFLAPDAMRDFLAHPERFGPGFGRESVPLLGLGVVVVAPLVEEALFRGVLLHRLAARRGPRWALVASALVFAVLHWNVPAMFVFGLFLGVLYLRTGSLAACMLVHAFNNLVPTLLSAGTPRAPGGAAPTLTLEMVRGQGPFMLLMFAVAAAILVGYIVRHWPARDAAMPYERSGVGAPDGAGFPIR